MITRSRTVDPRTGDDDDDVEERRRCRMFDVAITSDV